ncbi:hypothetical protein E2C01_057660 [Portunus trituberculatus]|uniref:Uncharacterized protein n=1 Tax=Portunus trituberculatus TaxID=210409 RepID=A0A5B7GTJ9_PORTR|nr:hypothetical protein [Portunus trituberculatus]
MITEKLFRLRFRSEDEAIVTLDELPLGTGQTIFPLAHNSGILTSGSLLTYKIRESPACLPRTGPVKKTNR